MRTLTALHVPLLIVLFSSRCHSAEPGQALTAGEAARARELITRTIEVNRHWLVGPPSTVRDFAYAFSRVGGTQRFVISNPGQASRSHRQAITYSSMLHALAAHPERATVTRLENDGERLRLSIRFSQRVRGAFGNGVDGSWSGYHTVGGEEGQLVLDPVRMVPVEVRFGRVHEVFDDYVQLDDGHLVPLSIRLTIEERTYHWRFRVHEPGLWLLDRAYLGDEELAQVSEVRVNGGRAEPLQVLESTLALERAEADGRERLALFLDANRNWLLPSLSDRRGLVYEYSQEAPYRERVWFAPEGHVMARLEASRESPEAPTRQLLWLGDGRRSSGRTSDPYVRIEAPSQNPSAYPDAWLQQDSRVQALAMGLGLDCALTRAARNPGDFRAEVRPVTDAPDRYLLVLRPDRDARLFTGTMLMFTSWAYMHDVRYQRAEILCDAATHRPLEERDYDARGQLKGHYRFDAWIDDDGAAAPGVIRAVIPHEKDGQDRSLEVMAAFRKVGRGIWLLSRVESRFRGGNDGSTGTVAVISLNAPDSAFEPVRALVDAARGTEMVIETIRNAGEGPASAPVTTSDWMDLPLNASWSDKARASASVGSEASGVPATPTIGIRRAHLSPTPAGATLDLEGLSTALWKEYQTEWTARLLDGRGNVLATTTTESLVRAAGVPAAFKVRLELDFDGGETALAEAELELQGRVLGLTAVHHGHGMWMSLARDP